MAAASVHEKIALIALLLVVVLVWTAVFVLLIEVLHQLFDTLRFMVELGELGAPYVR